MADPYRDFNGGNLPEPVPGSYFLHLELAHAGLHYGQSVSSSFCSCRLARSNADADDKKIEKTIFPVGFYRTKAKVIREICRTLIQDYSGKVPDEIDELLKLKGVGRKTANLVVTLGYRKPGICVDTHVHRISNRWGYVKTATPEKTEFALRDKLPKQYWIEYNDLLVSFGQHLCRPISPVCSQCPVERYCAKHGVTISR